ncbi:molybdopterin molybdotransferase MoeA [Sulfurimonas paralvinellae]|uniref:Molybdopterin molybdenumtransferase n=1 Tax=Sulfurimonas paralvinellae TaxID=317658 RepID=A0A7M1B9Y1_9BACT|nr:molybdopterin molybdotransferase MoeA [Sulfurimonas paralvinellae]QOP46441.1 molybdopterin molybdotransferase MoeA [Sulfurimonas paralvinellae]
MAVTIEKALELIYTNTKPKSLKIIPIEEALGYILAEDITAVHNLPPYDNSAMDGYAVKIEDSGKCVTVHCTIFAGDDFKGELSCGEAIKIMTGARIPLGTQCIVPIEDTQICDGGVKLPENLTISKHIRFAGEDIKKGQKLLSRGDKIDAHQITLLASQGISHIKVYKKPRIALFASGNELKMHFEQVEEYQLYNTNTPTLLARAKELRCEVEFIGTAVDTLDDIHTHIKSALDCDIIITSGGVSVGDADFTKEAFGNFGYEILFDKVEIKPGKPTTVGKIGDKMILNLPGNPLAAALNFELFGRSIIYAMSGAKAKFINPIRAKMKNDFQLRPGRRSVIPGYFDGEFFTVCEQYAPGMISPLAQANSFIIASQTCDFIKEGSSVKIISTKFSFTAKEFQELVTP